MIKYILRSFYKDEHDLIIVESNIKLWIYRTPIYRFFSIYIIGFFMLIYHLIKYKGDVEKIRMMMTMKLKDVKYENKKLKEKYIQLTNELDELKKRELNARTNNK